MFNGNIWPNSAPLQKTKGLRTNLAIGQSSRSCTNTRFLSQGVEIEPIFTLRAAFFEIPFKISKLYKVYRKYIRNFQNFHIWAWNLAIGQGSRSCTYTLFLREGGKSELISALWAAVFEIRGWFSKIFQWPKCQKWHIYSLSTTWGQNWAYFALWGSGFRDTGRYSKLPYLGMKLCCSLKIQKLHIYSLSTPGGRNGAYVRSTGSGFRDTGRFSKLP